MSPEMYQLNSCVTVQDHHLVIGGDPSSGQMPAIYIPLMTGGGQTKAEMRSISCQTEQKQDAKGLSKETTKKSPTSGKDEKAGKKLTEKQEKAEKKQEKKQQDKTDKTDKKSEKGEKSETDGTLPPAKFERSLSMREKKSREKKEEAFARSASLRYSEDEAKVLIKNINLKTCDIHQDKDKGMLLSLDFLFIDIKRLLTENNPAFFLQRQPEYIWH